MGLPSSIGALFLSDQHKGVLKEGFSQFAAIQSLFLFNLLTNKLQGGQRAPGQNSTQCWWLICKLKPNSMQIQGLPSPVITTSEGQGRSSHITTWNRRFHVTSPLGSPNTESQQVRPSNSATSLTSREGKAETQQWHLQPPTTLLTSCWKTSFNRPASFKLPDAMLVVR